MTKDLGTLHEVDGRMMLRFERRLAHPVERVWQMVTTPEGLARWFPARPEFAALEAGCAMTFTFEQADIDRAVEQGVEDVPLTSGGTIQQVDPPREFVFDWLGEIIRFELEPDGDGCRLVFTHTFDRDEAQAPKNGAGWHVCLDALAAALSGRAAPDEERASQLQALYARDLGAS